MDPKPEDIVAALAGNKTVAEPGAPVTGHLWDEYWKEVGRWAPFLGMAIPSPNGAGALTAAVRPIANPSPSALWPESQPRFNQAMESLRTEGAMPVKSATNPVPLSLAEITRMMQRRANTP